MVSQISDQINISIVIINYNSIELIKDCLQSFEKYSSGFTYEIIIVDNSDQTELQEKLNHFKNLKFITNKENKGFAAANNQGLKIANGEYILFLNNDTLFTENSIFKIFQFLSSKEEDIILGCKLLNKDLTLQHSVLDFFTVWNTFTSNFFLYLLFPKSKYFNKYYLMNRKVNYITEVDVVTGAFLLANRETLLELNGFDERFFFYAEEMDLCYRHKQNGGIVIYYPETSVIHLKGETTKKNIWFMYKNRSRAMIQFFQKHFSKIKLPFALIFHYLGLLIRIPILFIGGILTFNQKLIVQSYIFIKLFFYYPKNLFKSS